MATSFEQLLYGIGVQESGGNNYHVVNSIGAVGKYQVMKGNIPGWSKQVLGYSISWQTFRDSPALQEKIVRGILKGYYDKWGARGAAAAWYAGPGNHNLDQSTHSQYGGPSIKSYVDSVLNHGTKYKGGSSSSSGGGGGGGEDNKVPMSRGETAESYGYVQGLFDAVPELKKLFDKAVKNTWSPEKFQAAIRDSHWWKTHSQQERDYLTKTYGDPATAKQEYHSAYTHVQQMAAQLGIQGNDQTKKFLNAMTYNVAARGWSDDQLRAEMGKHVYFDGDNWNGQGGETVQKLKDYAYSMGVTMASTWYTNGARKVVRGMGSEQDLESQIRKQAKASFPQWSKQIDAGQTVMDLANPYLSSMSQILELPGGSLNLFDPTIKKALNYKDPNTGAGMAKPLWQFENELRSDPRWKKTQNAQDSLMQVGHQVLADFGLKY
jgi:hypothetical protein